MNLINLEKFDKQTFSIYCTFLGILALKMSSKSKKKNVSAEQVVVNGFTGNLWRNICWELLLTKHMCDVE